MSTGSEGPTRPLRIAMVALYLPSESKIGAGRQAHSLANVMTRRGHHVTMYSPCRRPDDAVYEHRHIPMGGSLRTFRWAWEVGQLDLSGFDLFHSHGDDQWRVGRSTPPHVRTLYGSCFSEALHIRGAKERARMALLGVSEMAATAVADRCVAISENTRRWFPWVGDVIPCGVDLDLFTPGEEQEPEPTILFVGTYHQRKRGWLLAEAFARHVRPHLPGARLQMVCTDAAPGPGIEVLGRLGDEELAERYRRAWAFCLPSTYEGFGVPYVEAMATGTPVVATPNVGAREVLGDGAFGEIVPDDQLGPRLLALLRDEHRRRTLRAAGLERARRYSWDVTAGAYEDLYQQVLPTRPA